MTNGGTKRWALWTERPVWTHAILHYHRARTMTDTAQHSSPSLGSEGPGCESRRKKPVLLAVLVLLCPPISSKDNGHCLYLDPCHYQAHVYPGTRVHCIYHLAASSIGIVCCPADSNETWVPFSSVSCSVCVCCTHIVRMCVRGCVRVRVWRGD